MKKILSLALAGVMMFSALPTAYAADVDAAQGTSVTVVGTGGEYTVTVPASLEPGQTGTVTASGYWASEATLVVSAPSTIEVTNGTQKANVNVSFAGIESAGSDLEEMNIPVSISIDDGGIKFGTWEGIIEYNVNLVSLIAFKIDGQTVYREDDMNINDWVDSKYNTVGAQIVTEGYNNYVKNSAGDKYLCILMGGKNYRQSADHPFQNLHNENYVFSSTYE